MEETPQHVLVVTPHPDDAEIWCGGTLARWIREGAEVHYILCTDGGKGTDSPDVTSEELSAIREQEQLDAAQVLGVKNVVMLHLPDGELEDTAEFRKAIVRQIRLVRPEVVLVTEPYRRNFNWHRDHRIAGQVALDAVFPTPETTCISWTCGRMRAWSPTRPPPYFSGEPTNPTPS
jgi:LmbE family N-acetylglucosaminyl deacetylase